MKIELVYAFETPVTSTKLHGVVNFTVVKTWIKNKSTPNHPTQSL